MVRLVDHTADLAIDARGPSQEACLADAAVGIAAVLTGRADVHKLGPVEREVHFVLEAPDEASLLVAVLSELLWLHESEDLLWVGGGVQVEEHGSMVRATASANALQHSPHQHGRGVEVKAVTYHGLRFVREGAGWRLWILLDI